MVWDYARGYIDFSPTVASNANLVELVEQWENRGIESSPAAYVNSEVIANIGQDLTRRQGISGSKANHNKKGSGSPAIFVRDKIVVHQRNLVRRNTAK